MPDQGQLTLFALDCGTTNWRLYRAEYRLRGASARMPGEPQPAPLTSFVDRRLPAILCLNPAGTALESFGEVAQGQLDNEQVRERVREHFKPCIGAHLEENSLPHQKRHTHAQALEYTRLLLEAVLEQIRQEKWRSAAFDDRVAFALAYPVHWRYDHGGQIFDEFARTVRTCFPEGFAGLRFVAEPEGAILCLARRGLLEATPAGDVALIVDVGGSTTDIVAGRVQARSGRLEFLGRHGEAFGGGLYDAELAGVIADELKVPASALSDDPSALISLRVSAQRLKESLSRQLLHAGPLNHVPQRTVTLVMQDGSIYRRVIALDEARFREATADLEAHFSRLIDNALARLQLREDILGQVVLVGGGAQLFTLIGHLRQRFGPEKVVLADNPEEVVVQGLSLEFGASMEKLEPTIQFPSAACEEEPAAVPAPQGSGWTLVGDEAQPAPLPIGVTTVGRGEESDLQVSDPKASRRHAELRATPARLELVDLGSTNGTYLNGKRLPAHQLQVLSPGDEIFFGKARFVCQQQVKP
ncbi:MAG: FHA domain-containing protein [Anaerolineales bacterium]|nr:FHA domain-containing protein [Anaerolineales bacterium]